VCFNPLNVNMQVVIPQKTITLKTREAETKLLCTEVFVFKVTVDSVCFKDEAIPGNRGIRLTLSKGPIEWLHTALSQTQRSSSQDEVLFSFRQTCSVVWEGHDNLQISLYKPSLLNMLWPDKCIARCTLPLRSVFEQLVLSAESLCVEKAVFPLELQLFSENCDEEVSGTINLSLSCRSVELRKIGGHRALKFIQPWKGQLQDRISADVDTGVKVRFIQDLLALRDKLLELRADLIFSGFQRLKEEGFRINAADANFLVEPALALRLNLSGKEAMLSVIKKHLQDHLPDVDAWGTGRAFTC
jgi:hypothetical protein